MMPALLGLTAIASTALISVSMADMQITPQGGGWGDPSETNKMLQMTKDPDVIRQATPEDRDHKVPANNAVDCNDDDPDAKGCRVNAGKKTSTPSNGGPIVTPAAQPTPRTRLDGSPGSTQQGFSLGQ